jgi:uncharacterized protein YdhG (YjbR/CyaY superfamily)
MAASKTPTVTQYLATLPADRRKEIAAVRKMVKANMPAGYKERLYRGMILWEIPLATYPDTYNGDPLCYVAIAGQKHHIGLYLMGAYMLKTQTEEIRAAFKAAGKKLDMGKSCIRFHKAEDLPLAALGKVIRSLPPALYIVRYEEIKKR